MIPEAPASGKLQTPTASSDYFLCCWPTSYREKFSISNNHALDKLHWLWYSHCANLVKVKVAQSCPSLCNPIDLVHGILQASILEWAAVPFSRESIQPRDRTQVSHIVGRFFTSWAIKEALMESLAHHKSNPPSLSLIKFLGWYKEFRGTCYLVGYNRL